MRELVIILLVATLLLQPACIWKLWSKEKPEEKLFDIYGTVESVSPEELVIQTGKGATQTFIMDPASIKGSEFGPGAYVHVYYKRVADAHHVTMVVEKIQ